MDTLPLTAEQRALVEDNMGLAFYASRSFRKHFPPYSDDVLGAAFLSLVRAAQNYDPALGSFATYACRYINVSLNKEVTQLVRHGITHLPEGDFELKRSFADDLPARHFFVDDWLHS